MGNWLFKELPVYKVYLGWLVFLLLLMVLASIVNPSPDHVSKAKARIIITRLNEADIAAALSAYSNTYGVFPTGDTESVKRILAGENLNGKNPQKTVFLNFQQSAEHSNEMTDPWGTPYQIQFFQQTNFTIRSASKDKILSDADDIIFNSASNDFVKP
jgi:hypothetical protein